MRRRAVLAGVVIFSAGCIDRAEQQVSDVASDQTSARSDRELGESISQDDISISVTESRMADQVRCLLDSENDQEVLPSDEAPASVVDPPSNADLWLAHVRVKNTDIETRTPPTFNPGSYRDAESNDIMVYGGSEKGVAEASQPLGFGYQRLEADGEKLDPYPPAPLTEDVAPNSELAGWVFGTIEAEAPPRLRIDAFDQFQYWSLQT